MYSVIGSAKTRAFRVLWLLEELGQPYTHIPAGAQSPEARAHNPTGKVPALIADGATITDSVAIMTYLADKHGAFTAPPGTIARANQDSLTHFLLDECDALLWTAARHSFVLPPEHRLPAIKDSLRFEYARSLSRLSARLTGPYLAGDAPSIADILAAHCLGWGRAIKFPEPDDKLAAYLAQMRARPAYLRTQSL